MKKKLAVSDDQRGYVMVYIDFLRSDTLDYYEKLIFIVIKSFARDGKAFPGKATIHRITGISMAKIKRCLKHMEELGVITVERRKKSNGDFQTNLYTLHDNKEMWTKKEESDAPNLAKGNAADTSFVQTYINNITNVSNESQEQNLERYSQDDIKQLFDYDIMMQQAADKSGSINSVMDILYDTMNSWKDTIRVSGQDKPRNVVIGRLMKLNYDSILYAVDKYEERTDRIKDPKAYMLTILYNAPGQQELDITNQVRHYMSTGKL